MKLSYSQLGNLIGTALYNAGIYDSPSRWSMLDDADSEYIYNTKLKNNHSCFDLLIIRNKVTGNKTFFFTFRTQLTNSEYRFRSGEFSSTLRGYVVFEGNNIYVHGGNTGHGFLSNVNGLDVAYVEPNSPSNIDYVAGFSSHMGSMTPSTNYWRGIGDGTMAMFNGYHYLNHAQSEYGYFYEYMTKEQCMDVNNFEYEFLYHNEIFWDEPDPPDPPDPPTPTDWAPTMEDFNMELELWSNFSKRKNSTKRPNIPGTVLNVTLMEPTSIMRPTFIITNVNFTWNYCKFGGRYYFINNITSVDKERIALECQIDVLATWKSNIMGSSAYIKRSAWATSHMLIDSLNPPTDQIVMKTAESGSALGIDNNIYYYIFVSGGAGNSLYKLDKTNFDKLIKALWDENILTPDQRGFIMSMIVKCFSMQYSLSGTSVTQIEFGPTTCTDLVAERISLSQPSENVNLGNIVIPFASADWGYNTETYLDHSPYTTGLLYLPGVGVTSLDLDVIGSTRQITVFAFVAKSTGEVTYKITTDSGKILSTFSGSLASDIPLSSGGYDPYAKMQATMSVIGGGVAFAAGALTGNALMALGGIGAMGAGTVNQMKAAEIHSMVNGAMSSNIALAIGEGRKAKAITITKIPVNTDIEHNKSLFGLPVESVGSLNASGYVQTSGANIQMAGTEQEKIEVNGLLDSGIFIE